MAFDKLQLGNPVGEIFDTVNANFEKAAEQTGSYDDMTVGNATKLNSQEASYYLNYDNLTNKPTIPNPANYYWANVNLSSSSSTTTVPTFDATFKVSLSQNDSFAPDGTWGWGSPIAKYLWHDLLAFKAAKAEYSTDGETWIEDTSDNAKRLLTNQKENQALTVINDNKPYARFTWSNTTAAWHACQAEWLVIGFTYVSPAATCTIKFQTSADDTTWTDVFTKSLAGNQVPYWLRLTSGWSQTKSVRLLIQRTSTTGSTSLSAVKFLTKRWGNQGQGSELEKPYTWDNTPNLLPKVANTSSLGGLTTQWNDIYGKTLYEDGTSLVKKYLGIGDKAVSSKTADKVANTLAIYTSGSSSPTSYDGSLGIEIQQIKKAEQDSDGNKIVDTYLTKSTAEDTYSTKDNLKETQDNLTELSESLSDYATKTFVEEGIDEAVQGLLGGNVEAAYDTFKEIQDLLKADDTQTADLISKVNTNTTNISSLTTGKLDKTTYEWNKEISFGSTGNLLIGRFPMYDSNVTVRISATTTLTYSGTLVIATQNVKSTQTGTIKAVVYGDAENTIAPNIYIERISGTNILSVFFKPQPWSKNLIHIQAVNLNTNPAYGDVAPPKDICTSVSSIPDTATIQPTNALTTKFLGITGTAEAAKYAVTAGNVAWDNITSKPTSFYTLPNATTSALGGVKVGSNITVDNGTISLTKSNVTSALGYTPPTTNTTYSQATSSTLGLVKIGFEASNKNYPVELNNSGQMFVNVPWTDTNTTYGGGSGLKLVSNNFSVNTDFTTSGQNYAVKVDSASGGLYTNVNWTDTKNTAGSTNSESKIYLVGATSQASNPQTYSDAEVYTEAGELNATSICVSEAVQMQYDSSAKCLRFVFA